MNIVVLIKQVPDTTDVKIDPKTGTLIREASPPSSTPTTSTPSRRACASARGSVEG